MHYSHELADTEPMALEPPPVRVPLPDVVEHYGDDARALWRHFCIADERDELIALVH